MIPFRAVRYTRNFAFQKIKHSSPGNKFALKLLAIVLFVVSASFLISHRYDDLSELKNSLYERYAAASNEPFFNGVPRNMEGIKIDWHDYGLLEAERNRSGPGEHGKPFSLDQDEDIKLNEKLFTENGYYAVVSDKIAIDRSVTDLRPPECKKKLYLQELPTVSVIVIFYNEHWSTLLRTVHSILNRSPPQLLKEIIMVNDHSTKKFLWKPLENYIREELPPGRVKLIHMPTRSGLILARLAGLRRATGDVLIVLDSHTEVNTNWLPPLLEPIAINYRTCVCPTIDVIGYDTFEYRTQDGGRRGAFDWKLNYKRMALRPQDIEDPTEPFESPIMAGGLFAISAKFFWELGGYDEGLDIWGGEQYELSFKIWQCGGRMVDAPCSHVGHVFRGYSPFPNPRGTNFIIKNYKRVAEVWMDEYKEYVYERNPQYLKTDAGDLSQQKALRERLNCKSFRWFLEEIAPDLLERYPVREPPPFASGRLRNLGSPDLCLDSLSHKVKESVGVYLCAKNKTNPQTTQFFTLTYARDIRSASNEKCLDASDVGVDVIFYNCHESQGNQLWKFEMDKKIIRHGKTARNQCLDLIDKKVTVSKCDPSKKSQQWEWGFVNVTNMNNWNSYGFKLLR
ncbi:N-acetylgalactosaminyltransferase 6-like [Uranotaenia lowii]|uniref:N-acetylgalactosaminyltransferase 6-like n=1 Tax=Uranotaenia lowii TaxID=190385 RepID=UPI00247947DD|nr:N-acetylgalactosaminyltransferase 6-like [Uranotaenia lowii]